MRWLISKKSGKFPLSRIYQSYSKYSNRYVCADNAHLDQTDSKAGCSVSTLSVIHLGPVVQSVISLTSSLRVISLTVLVDSIYNILIFFAEKM